MDELPARIGELDVAREKLLVVYCHHGVRSLGVVAALREAGFESVRSMAGGIDRWSREVDPSIATYS